MGCHISHAEDGSRVSLARRGSRSKQADRAANYVQDHISFKRKGYLHAYNAKRDNDKITSRSLSDEQERVDGDSVTSNPMPHGENRDTITSHDEINVTKIKSINLDTKSKDYIRAFLRQSKHFQGFQTIDYDLMICYMELQKLHKYQQIHGRNATCFTMYIIFKGRFNQYRYGKILKNSYSAGDILLIRSDNIFEFSYQATDEECVVLKLSMTDYEDIVHRYYQRKMTSIYDTIYQASIFQYIPMPLIKHVEDISTVEFYQKGDVIVHEGDDAKDLFLIQHGEVIISSHTNDQNKRRSLTCPSSVGEEEAILCGSYNCTVVANGINPAGGPVLTGLKTDSIDLTAVIRINIEILRYILKDDVFIEKVCFMIKSSINNYPDVNPIWSEIGAVNAIENNDYVNKSWSGNMRDEKNYEQHKNSKLTNNRILGDEYHKGNQKLTVNEGDENSCTMNFDRGARLSILSEDDHEDAILLTRKDVVHVSSKMPKENVNKSSNPSKSNIINNKSGNVPGNERQKDLRTARLQECNRYLRKHYGENPKISTSKMAQPLKRSEKIDETESSLHRLVSVKRNLSFSSAME